LEGAMVMVITTFVVAKKLISLSMRGHFYEIINGAAIMQFVFKELLKTEGKGKRR
jgi:hypothetical protein